MLTQQQTTKSHKLHVSLKITACLQEMEFTPDFHYLLHSLVPKRSKETLGQMIASWQAPRPSFESKWPVSTLFLACTYPKEWIILHSAMTNSRSLATAHALKAQTAVSNFHQHYPEQLEV